MLDMEWMIETKALKILDSLIYFVVPVVPLWFNLAQ